MIPNKTIEDLIDKHSLLEKDLSSSKIDKKLFAGYLVVGFHTKSLLFVLLVIVAHRVKMN